MPAKWFVLRTHPSQEFRASRELNNQSFKTSLPAIKVMRRGKSIKRPLFAGYLFVNFNPSTRRWSPILSTIGVKNFVGYTPGHPLPPSIRPDDWRELKARIKELQIEALPQAPKPIAIDMMVRVLFGPFQDMEGKVAIIHGSRIGVLMKFLGVEREVKLDRACLIPA